MILANIIIITFIDRYLQRQNFTTKKEKLNMEGGTDKWNKFSVAYEICCLKNLENLYTYKFCPEIVLVVNKYDFAFKNSSSFGEISTKTVVLASTFSPFKFSFDILLLCLLLSLFSLKYSQYIKL